MIVSSGSRSLYAGITISGKKAGACMYGGYSTAGVFPMYIQGHTSLALLRDASLEGQNTIVNEQ